MYYVIKTNNFIIFDFSNEKFLRTVIFIEGL